MNLATLLKLWESLKGWRTYLATAAAVLAQLATIAGFIPTPAGQSATVIFAGLAAIALRLAQSDHNPTLAEALETIQQLRNLIDGTKPGETLDLTRLKDEPPATIPFPSSPFPGGRTLNGVVLFLALAATAQAAQPKAIIEGSDPSISGEIVVLDGSASEGMPANYSWEITPEIKGRRNLLSLDQGKRVVVHSFPGDYLVELIVSNADGHSRAIRQLHIPGNAPPSPTPQPVPPQPVPVPPTPPVPPQPNPGPAPTPAPEPALTGIALNAYLAAMAVDSPTRAKDAACLAAGCQALSASLVAGKFSGTSLAIAQAAVAEMGAVMDRCTNAAWTDAREAIATKVEQLWKAGQLKTTDNWKSVLDQVETGLRRVK